jgi:hypothetical protein
MIGKNKALSGCPVNLKGFSHPPGRTFFLNEFSTTIRGLPKGRESEGYAGELSNSTLPSTNRKGESRRPARLHNRM